MAKPVKLITLFDIDALFLKLGTKKHTQAKIAGIKKGETQLAARAEDNEVENGIIHHIGEWFRQVGRNTIDRVREALSLFENLGVDGDGPKDIFNRAKTFLNKEVLPHLRDLSSWNKQLSDALVRLEAWRAANHSQQTPIFVDRILLLKTTIAIVALEGVINALALFSSGELPGGWLGVFFFAMSVGVVNVALGWLCGDILWRNRDRLYIWPLLVSIGGIVLIVNVAFGAVRGGGWDGLLLVTPLDINIWLFTVIGVLIFVFVFAKWYRSSDDDPELRELGQLISTLEKDIQESTRYLNDLIVNTGEEAIDQIDQLVADEGSDIALANEALLDIAAAQAEELNEKNLVKEVHEALIERVRGSFSNANLENLPAYCSEKADLSWMVNSVIDQEALKTKLNDQIIPKYEALVAEAKVQKDRVRQEVDALLIQLNTEAEHALNIQPTQRQESLPDPSQQPAF